MADLLPECLDDWVDGSNPVGAIHAFVDALELRELGFEAGVTPVAPAGRDIIRRRCSSFISMAISTGSNPGVAGSERLAAIWK